ncbi:methyl-accepting chemotaxis protein [Natronospira bacteriovora]|uniref:Methyl-accepting chemotaxis protein n=1 Tax=Natronospira bacteriovora TaxID=3069753 RepID=A0ABU0W627_9GAMM|nr:methyl-accepting chemotaxis protein [Natronospira sp. AB-CW4]MDQ2069223.1 methyl-accepting chemotaxis protein [Natronospira sp. AB-CW4]
MRQSVATQMSVRWKLRLSVGLLASLLIAMVIWQALMIYLPQRAQGQTLSLANSAIDASIAASLSQAEEREQVLARLAGERGNTDSAASRDRGNSALEKSLHLSRALTLRSRADVRIGQAIDAVEEQHRRVDALRRQLDRNRSIDTGQWFQAMTDLIEAQSRLRLYLSAATSGESSVSLNNAAIKQKLWRAAELGSRERAVIRYAMAGQRSAGQLPSSMRQALSAQGVSAQREIRDALHLIAGLDAADTRRRAGTFNSMALFLLPDDREAIRSSIQDAMGNLEQRLTVNTTPATQVLLAQADPGEADSDLAALLRESSATMGAIEEMIDAISDDAASRARDLYADGLWSIWTVIAMLLAGLTLSVLALLTVETIGRRIASLAGTMSKAATDHDLTVRATGGGGQELDELARTFNYFQARFATLIQDIVTSANDATREMSQLLASSRFVEKGAENQDRDIDQLAAAMNQMATAVDHVADHTATAADAANEADQTARRGRTVVGEAVTVIQRLNDETANITKVLDTISEIASQTNMLSLNASVEAARAKEHGRGFAVVADEVRRLANRTREATADVQKLLGQFREHSALALRAMAGDPTDSEDGVDSADRALEAIVHSVASIRDMSNEVAAAARQQSQVATDMNRRIGNIADISQSTSASARDSATTVESVDEILGRLSRLASAFRIDAGSNAQSS